MMNNSKIRQIAAKTNYDEIVDSLKHVEYRTDDFLRAVQLYNLPHFVDLNLSYIKTLYDIEGETCNVWGAVYHIGNFYTPNDNPSDIRWDKLWMNEIMNYPLNSKRRPCTPFILFHELEDGSYEVININETAVEMRSKGRPYLYIHGIFDGYENGVITDTNKLKCLILPVNTNYICSNMEGEEDREETLSKFNDTYKVPCANITISEDNKLTIDADDWYEKIKMICPEIQVYKGNISNTDIAIKVAEDMEFGNKVFIDSIILVNKEGHICPNIRDYVSELENNVFRIKDGLNLAGYYYYVFYYKEADKSVNYIYNMPEYVIDHDIMSLLQNKSSDTDYILGLDTFKNLIEGNQSLISSDIRDTYKQNFLKEITNESYNIYLKDNDGNVVRDENGMPLLDRTLFINEKDGTIFEPELTDVKDNNYKAYIQFINYWFKRVIGYKKELIQEYVDSQMKLLNNDKLFTSITYKANEIPGIVQDNGTVRCYRTKWTLYEHEDSSYSGYSDILLFVNGLLSIRFVSYTKKSKYFYIDQKAIIEEFGEDATIEVIYVNNNCNKVTDVIIGLDTTNLHKYMADRYYEPNNCNFYSLIYDKKMNNSDLEMIYHINDISNPTLAQPLPFTWYQVMDPQNNYSLVPETYSIMFNENWMNLINVKDAIGAVIGNDSNNDTLWVFTKTHTYGYDMSPITAIIPKKFESVQDYLANNKFEPITIFENDEDTITNMVCGITYEKDGILSNGIARVYGPKGDNSIEIIYPNGDSSILYTTNNEYLGQIQKICNNYYSNRFAVLNSNSILYEYVPFNGKYSLQRGIEINIKDLNPIVSLTEENIAIDRNSEVIYSPLHKKVILLSNYKGKDNSIITIYNITTDNDNEYYEVAGSKEIELNMNFVGSKLAYDNENTIYIVGGNSGYTELDKVLYKYDILNETISKVCDYPDDVGYSEINTLYTSNFIYIFGGFGDFNTTSNKISRYNIVSKKWESVELDFNITGATIFEQDPDTFYIIGGFINEDDTTIDFENVSCKVYKLHMYKLFTGEEDAIDNMNDFPVPIINAQIIKDINSNLFYIIGNEYPDYSNYVYRYDTLSETVMKLFEMPLDFDYYDLCQFNYTDHFSSVLMVGDLVKGYNYSKILCLIHKDIDSLFVDKYGQYCVLHNGIIYIYNEEALNWIPEYNLTELIEEAPINKIVLSGDVYCALSDGNILFTSPDLDHWYDYKFNDFYTSEKITESNQIINIEAMPNIDKVLFTTKDGNILYNNFNLNLSMIYNNSILAVPKKRFAVQDFQIDKDSDYVTLSEDFKYCTDVNHYMVFEDGILLEPNRYKVVTPEVNNPINGINVYLQFDKEYDENQTSSIITVVYAPFFSRMISSFNNMNKAGIIKIEQFNMRELGEYGLSKDWNWIFNGGRKLPYNYLKNISNNMMQLLSTENFKIYDDISILKLIDNGDGFIFEDEYNDFINSLITSISDWGKGIINVDNVEDFIAKASIEEKITLLKIYADHYVVNADKYGNTAPFELDSEYTLYPVLDGNVEWRN